MHGSVWRFSGDPDELAAKYERMLESVPAASMRLHVAMRTADGLLVVDTCPSEEAFREFVAGPFMGALTIAGLPEPEIVGHPVVAAFSGGGRVA